MSRLIAILIACAALTTQAPALEPATKPAVSFDYGAYGDEVGRKVFALRDQLTAAAATKPAHPIAGQYYQGDGLGMNLLLTIGPSMQYTATWRGCLGMYYMDHGTVTMEGSAIELHPQLKQPADQTMRIETKLLRVPWGKRTYLLAARDMDYFIKSVNRSVEPRDDMHGIGYLKVGDEEIEVAGDPELPAEAKMLLEPTVTAKVIAVGDEEFRYPKHPGYATRMVTLDVGRNRGVEEKSSFSWIDNGERRSVYVTQVDKETSRGELGGSGGAPSIAVGTEVRSRGGKPAKWD